MGDLDCCGVAAKYVIFVFNFLVLIGGTVFLILGIVGLVNDDFSRFEDFDPDLYRAAAVLFIVAGATIFLLSFLGCCGAVRENKCMLLTYATIVFVLFIIVVTASALAVVFKGDAAEIIDEAMLDFLKHYDPDDPEDVRTKAWDELQEQGKCCGIDSSNDWTNNGFQIPSSCYDSNNELYGEGCLTKYVGNVEDFTGSVGIVGLIFAAVLLAAVILSFCVGCQI